MRDRLGVSDTVSISITRGSPQIFRLSRPAVPELKIPLQFPFTYIRVGDFVEFDITANSLEEAEALLDNLLP